MAIRYQAEVCGQTDAQEGFCLKRYHSLPSLKRTAKVKPEEMDAWKSRLSRFMAGQPTPP